MDSVGVEGWFAERCAFEWARADLAFFHLSTMSFPAT